MRALLSLLVACGSSGPRIEPSKASPADAGVRDGTSAVRDAGPGELRVAKRFTLVMFELEPKTTTDGPTAERFTYLLREMANEYRGITIQAGRKLLLDMEIMSGCQRRQPNCLARIAKGMRADRIIFGDVAGPEAHVGMFDVASDQTTEWVTDKLSTDDGELRALAHDAMDALLARTP